MSMSDPNMIFPLGRSGRSVPPEGLLRRSTTTSPSVSWLRVESGKRRGHEQFLVGPSFGPVHVSPLRATSLAVLAWASWCEIVEPEPTTRPEDELGCSAPAHRLPARSSTIATESVHRRPQATSN